MLLLTILYVCHGLVLLVRLCLGLLFVFLLFDSHLGSKGALLLQISQLIVYFLLVFMLVVVAG